MTKNSNWAALVSVAVGVMATGCTVTTDDVDAGTGGSAAAGSAGASGADSGSSTGGSSGTAVTTDAAAEATADAVAMRACEACIYTTTCRDEAAACRADTNGCADAVDDFYDCLAGGTGDSVSDCGTNFTSEAQVHGGDAAFVAGDLANGLAGCVMDTDCVTSCRTADAGR
jgi:hypothetical protein